MVSIFNPLRQNNDNATPPVSRRGDVLEGLFSRRNGGGVCGDTLESVVEEIASTNGSHRAVVAQGIGVQIGGIPLRFLSYFVPTFELLGQLPESVSAEVYIASHGIARANQHDSAEQVQAQASAMGAMIQGFAREFYGNVAHRVRVLFDSSVEADSSTAAFIESVCDRARDALLADSAIKNFIDKRGTETALRYVVEHSIYMRDPIQSKPIRHLLVPGMESEVDRVVMIGGESERIFYKARQIIQRTLGTNPEWKTHQLFCVVGEKRPTYHLEAGEPAWEDIGKFASARELIAHIGANVTKEFGRRSSVARDALLLLAAAGRFSMLPKDNWFELITQGTLPAPEIAALEDGFQRFRRFVENVAW